MYITFKLYIYIYIYRRLALPEAPKVLVQLPDDEETSDRLYVCVYIYIYIYIYYVY